MNKGIIMSKIKYQDYINILLDENSSDNEIREYSIIVKGEGAFEWKLAPDPTKVNLEDFEDLENAMSIGNSLARYRRSRSFKKRLKKPNRPPVIVTEGDSWFQFPFLIDEVVDHLNNHFLVWSVGAAGDTVKNMVYGKEGKKKMEYMKALKSQLKNDVKAFLFSGAGNDIIGEDPDTGESALYQILNDYDSTFSNAQDCINSSVLESKMEYLKNAYAYLIETIRSVDELKGLPILFHGYDYVLPYPQGKNDKRDPVYANKDEWLGSAFRKRGYSDDCALRNEVIRLLIDRLYVVLSQFTKDPAVHIVDCRGSITDVNDWKDEIHGRSRGFKTISDRFVEVLNKVLIEP